MSRSTLLLAVLLSGIVCLGLFHWTLQRPVGLFTQGDAEGYHAGAVLLLAALLLAALLLVPSSASAIAPGQHDDFQSGTVLNWIEGALSPNPPTNVPNAGPLGPGDNCLQNISSGEDFTSGGRMNMFNQSQWAGNYVAAGVSAIQMNVVNRGATPLTIRVALEGADGTRYSATTGVPLPADGVWRSAFFILDAAHMSLVGGPSSFNTVLANVVTFRINSRAGSPGWQGDVIAGTLGVDNIQASTVSGVDESPRAITSILTNSPNPFRGSTLIRYGMDRPSNVSIEIFDVLGRLVRRLETSEPKDAGPHEVTWDGRDETGREAVGGIYFLKVLTPSGSESRRVVKVN